MRPTRSGSTSGPVPEKPAETSQRSEAASRRAGKATPFLASKVTARSQTTLPSGVRKALGLRAGDQIAYQIDRDRVIIRKVTDEDNEDPVLAGFLDLLEDDVAQNKELIVFATEGFARYLEELTAGIEVDYDAPIEGDFQL
jgi:antitoxin PrlF